jgi:hypothetical protein
MVGGGGVANMYVYSKDLFPLDGGEGLQESSLLCELVQAVVRGTLVADEPAESEGGEFTSVEALLVHVANVNLHRCVVLSSDQAVGG